jgi:glycosyltransferase involved in cell wall biosynthesis
MQSITLLSLPPSAGPSEKGIVWGADVVKSGFVKALLQHGTYDRYYFLCGASARLNEAKEQLARYPNHKRAELVLLDEYWKLKHVDQMVIFDSDPILHTQAGLRKFQGRASWPITGVTHSLSHHTYLPYAIQTILADIYEYDCLICTSHAGRRAVENILSGLCEYLEQKYRTPFLPKFQLPVIPLGIDVEQFQPGKKVDARRRCGLSEEHVIFLYVGRFSIDYKMDLFPLVMAFSQIMADKSDKKMTLVLAGSDVQYEVAPRLRRFGDALGLGDNLVVLANIKNEQKNDLYRAADVFVSLSDNVQETFGLTIIEAMSAGLPVIGSDWNGYRETIEHGKTGFLVPVYWADCVDLVSRSAVLRDPMEVHKQLAQAVSVDIQSLIGFINLLSEDEALRREMGERARKRALQYYDWPVIVEAYEELWGNLMEQGRLSSGHEDSKHSVYTYDYMNVFEHYSTGVITKTSILGVTPIGRAFLENTIDLQALAHTELLEILPLVDEILNTCNSKEGVMVDDFIRQMGAGKENAENKSFQYISRLVKYGLLDAAIPGRVG